MNQKVAILLTILFAAVLLVFYNMNPTESSIEKNVGEEKTIYGSILTASAAILAITFTVSQYTIGKISKDYSPYLVDYYYKIDKMGGFVGFIATIVISAAG